MALAELTLTELLSRLAAATPAPGGGSAAALSGALAAALAQMAAGFVLARDGADDEAATAQRDRALVLRGQLLALADADAVSYRPVLDALALDRADPVRAPELRRALSDAAAVPLEIARACVEVAELAAAVHGARGGELLAGDAGAAVLIAEAAVASAVALVRANLASLPDDPRLARAGALGQRAHALRAALAAPGQARA